MTPVKWTAPIWEIWVIPATGGVATRLTPGSFTGQAPDWSPDGSHISFQSGHLGFYLWIIPATGGIPTQVTTGHDHHPSWSPYGAQLAFESLLSGNWDIWVTDGPVPAEYVTWGAIKAHYR